MISENTYKGRQGTGLATVLGGAQTPLKMDAAAEAKKARMSAAQKKLREQEIPDHWYRYNTEIQKDYDEMFNMGARIMGEGRDPFTSVDADSQAFQKKLSRLESKANASKQLKGYYDQQRTLVQAKPDGYEGWDELNNFLGSNTLEDIVSKGMKPPTLTKATPQKDLYPFYKDMVSEAMKQNGDKPLSRDDISTLIDFRLNNPEDSEELIKTYQAKAKRLRQTDPDYMKDLETRAGTYSGGDVMKQMMVEDAMMFNKQDYTIEEMAQDIAEDMRVRTSKVERGDVTILSAGVSDKALKNRIRLKLQSDPRAWAMAPGNTIEEKTENFYKENKDAILGSIAGRRYERIEDEDATYGGYGRDQIDDNFNKWYDQFKKGYQQAADYLVGIKLPGENLSIYKTENIGTDKTRVYLRGQAIDRIQQIAKSQGKSTNDIMALLEDPDEVATLPPDVQSSIKNIVSEFGKGTYVEKEGSIYREYDLATENDKEWMREAYKSSLKHRKDLYLEVDEEKVEPGGRIMIPGQSNNSGPFIPSFLKSN